MEKRITEKFLLRSDEESAFAIDQLLAEDGEVSGENGFAEGEARSQSAARGDGPVGVDDNLCSAIERYEFGCGDEVLVEVNSFQVEGECLLFEGKKQPRISGSCNHETGAVIGEFHCLPGIEKKIDTFVGEDQSLPEYKGGCGRYAKLLQNGATFLHRKIIEKRSMRNDGDERGIEMKLFDQSCLDGG